MPVKFYVPEPVRQKPEFEAWQRRLRKWILYIGIPLIIAGIIIGGYLVTRKARPVAQQPTVNLNTPTPKANLGENFTLENLKLDKATLKLNHETLVNSLMSFDSWGEIKGNDKCYSNLSKQISKRTSWKDELSELKSNQRANYLDSKVKFETNQKLITEQKDTLNWVKNELTLIEAIENFIEQDETQFQAWSKTVDAISKLCLGSVNELIANCSNLNTTISDYEKQIKESENTGLLESIAKIKTFCDSVKSLVEANNINNLTTKLTEINQEFKSIVSTYPQSKKTAESIQLQLNSQTDILSKINQAK